MRSVKMRGCHERGRTFILFAVASGASVHIVILTKKLLKRDQINLPYCRTGYVIEVHIPQSMFKLLPKELQRGQTIKVAAVVFNIGINEQATFAERYV